MLNSEQDYIHLTLAVFNGGAVPQRSRKIKFCRKCKQEKEIQDFYKDPCRKTGLSPYCKVCDSEDAKLSYQRNKDKRAVQKAQYRALNKEKIQSIKRRWYENNKHLSRAINAEQRALRRNAKPIWFSELDSFIIKEAHLLAEQRESITGIKWHVDHIVPLRGSNVCGLHIGINMQVISATANIRKSNKF